MKYDLWLPLSSKLRIGTCCSEYDYVLAFCKSTFTWLLDVEVVTLAVDPLVGLGSTLGMVTGVSDPTWVRLVSPFDL